MKSESQLTTESSIFGHWRLNNENVNIEVLITPQIVRLNYNGVVEEFSSNAHWMGDHHLCFWGPYYVFSATKEFLTFGKHKSGLIGDYEWEHTLSRVV